ncbi:hypothetical protein [Salinispira pacifica]
MFGIGDLSHREKVFFAGCLRGMILADGYAKDEEVAGLNQLRDDFDFSDLDECLDEFERTVRNQDQFWDMAAQVTRKEARELILRRLDEISRLDGYKSTNETEFYDRLERSWS